MKLTEHSVPAEFDPEQIEKVLRNLFGNALKFTHSGGTVDVALHEEAGEGRERLVVTVSDDGPGIPADSLPHIFERFYQADSSQIRRQPGTGIGLALAKEIVELHGGSIEAFNREGSGSTFVVRMPVGHVDLSGRNGSGTMFSPSEGRTPTPAFPPVPADEIREDPDDGAAILPSTRAAGDDVTTVLIVQEGADDYLSKPFRMKELMARVENLISLRRRLKSRLQKAAQVASDVSQAPSEDLSDDGKLLAQVRDVIEANLSDEDLTVDNVAEAVGMSATLYRRLSALLDQPPMELVWQMRLEQAAGLLRQRRGTVSEVAYAVGFKSVSHFSTRF
ncbi:MAG: ATP-binding protein, partial [Rhodothermales bacterium]